MRDYYDETLQRWNHPTGFDSDENFIGRKPTGYVIYSRNRDSSILEETNFTGILEDLGGEGDFVKVIRHGHWACGWIEYITVSDEAPNTLLDQCVEIGRALSNYPIWEEQAYSNAQWEAIGNYWEGANLKYRVHLCQEAGVSVFAARRDEVPSEVYDRLTDEIY